MVELEVVQAVRRAMAVVVVAVMVIHYQERYRHSCSVRMVGEWAAVSDAAGWGILKPQQVMVHALMVGVVQISSTVFPPSLSASSLSLPVSQASSHLVFGQ